MLLCIYLPARKAKLFDFAGKEVHPVLRYRDADGSVFSQTTNSFGQTQTQSVFTAAASSSLSSSTASDSARSGSRRDSSSSDSGGILRYDLASDSEEEEEEEEVASHLQRLQSLAGNWKLKQTNKRARAANKSPQQDDSDNSTSDGGQQGQASFQLPPVPPMQVYLHGIDEAVLQAALTTSALWERIQLQDSLQASCSEVFVNNAEFHLHFVAVVTVHYPENNVFYRWYCCTVFMYVCKLPCWYWRRGV